MADRTLTDHDTIKAWAKEHNAAPVVVSDTKGEQGGLGLLRLAIGEPDDGLERVEWDAWLDEFESEGLALIVSDEDGNDFNKIVSRD